MTTPWLNSVRPASAGGGRACLPRLRSTAQLAALALLAVSVGLSGCETPPNGPANAPGIAPAPAYTGPAYLRGTIGSLVGLRPGTDQPQLVNGYGIVVNLNGTGSTSAPPAMRQALINQMKKYGLGSATMRTLDMTPERVLADPNTTVVRIDGIIPPGASAGLRFDVLVTAIDSQTTSLEGGTLWTSPLGVNGANQAFRFLHEQATAYGPIFDNPYNNDSDTGEPDAFSGPQALVVAGGKVTTARELDLVLNQSSYSRSRAIADRINERFGRPTDDKQLAHPMSDQLIRINVPPRYQNNPGEVLELIMHLYLQTGPGFEQEQARRLAEVLRNQPEQARSVRMAWQSLGRPVVQVLRDYYQDPQLSLRLASLEAGAWLQDERASQHLSELAGNDDPAVRMRVAKALALLPDSLTGSRTLGDLLDDSQTAVRVAAYESMSANGDRLITNGRVLIPDEMGTGVKYVIDTVPSEKPLVYITQVGVPRIVIFNPDLGYKQPLLARLWDNRLMLSMPAEQTHVDLFYQPPSGTASADTSSTKLKAMPDLKTLVYIMGHKPTAEEPGEGLDLTYSQVVDVVYQLCRKGYVESPIEVVGSPLAKLVADMEGRQDPVQPRPETSDPTAGASSEPGLAPIPSARPDAAYRPETGVDPSTASSR